VHRPPDRWHQHLHLGFGRATGPGQRPHRHRVLGKVTLWPGQLAFGLCAGLLVHILDIRQPTGALSSELTPIFSIKAIKVVPLVAGDLSVGLTLALHRLYHKKLFVKFILSFQWEKVSVGVKQITYFRAQKNYSHSLTDSLMNDLICFRRSYFRSYLFIFFSF